MIMVEKHTYPWAAFQASHVLPETPWATWNLQSWSFSNHKPLQVSCQLLSAVHLASVLRDYGYILNCRKPQPDGIDHENEGRNSAAVCEQSTCACRGTSDKHQKQWNSAIEHTIGPNSHCVYVHPLYLCTLSLKWVSESEISINDFLLASKNLFFNLKTKNLSKNDCFSVFTLMRIIESGWKAVGFSKASFLSVAS